MSWKQRFEKKFLKKEMNTLQVVFGAKLIRQLSVTVAEKFSHTKV